MEPRGSRFVYIKCILSRVILYNPHEARTSRRLRCLRQKYLASFPLIYLQPSYMIKYISIFYLDKYIDKCKYKKIRANEIQPILSRIKINVTISNARFKYNSIDDNTCRDVIFIFMNINNDPHSK